MPSIDGQALMAPVRQAIENGTAQEKGATLEQAFTTLLLAMPGIPEVQCDVLDEFESEEVDLVVWNDKDSNGLPFLPEVFLVECKNWSSAVSSKEIKIFGTKLRERACIFGVFVAANGITGQDGEQKAGNAAIAHLLHDQIKMVVLTLQDLEGISSTEEFGMLLKQRIMRLVGGRGQLGI